jgi:hypothetical protein
VLIAVTRASKALAHKLPDRTAALVSEAAVLCYVEIVSVPEAASRNAIEPTSVLTGRCPCPKGKRTVREGAMWTLVIIVVMSSVQGGSGTSNSIQSVGNFSSQQRCDAAAKAIAHAGVVQGSLQANGVYEIRTHCVGL